MRLSIDKINQDDMTVRFATKNGVVYRVGFYKDPYFLGERAYHFFIANENQVITPKDVDVYKVITCVIEEFFRQDKSVMLYICDPHDHREAIRDNLYKRWFNSYPQRDELTLQTEELNFEGYIVYTGMILRKDNPDYDELLTLYKAFIERANRIYHIQPK